MKTSPQISIICPVYKAEAFLHRCVDSVLAQTYPDFELILVNDGSPDNSGAICDEYAKKDSRIRVLHKENGGVSSARNLGLKNVKGKYVTFLDSDDEFKEDCLEIINSKIILDIDIIRFDFATIAADNSKTRLKAKNSTKLETQRNLVFERRTILGVCGGAYKTSLFDNNLEFNLDVKYGEDWIVLYSLFCKALSYTYIKNCLYLYRSNESSVTRNCGIDELHNMLLAKNYLLKASQYYGIEHSYKSKSFLITNMRIILMQYDIKCFFDGNNNYYKKRNFPKQSFFKDCIFSLDTKNAVYTVFRFYLIYLIKRKAIY